MARALSLTLGTMGRLRQSSGVGGRVGVAWTAGNVVSTCVTGADAFMAGFVGLEAVLRLAAVLAGTVVAIGAAVVAWVTNGRAVAWLACAGIAMPLAQLARKPERIRATNIRESLRKNSSTSKGSAAGFLQDGIAYVLDQQGFTGWGEVDGGIGEFAFRDQVP